MPSGSNLNLPPPSGASGNALVTIPNPLGDTSTLCGLLLKILQVAATLAIPIMVLFLVYVGFQFVVARGNTTGLANAKRNLYYTVAGIGLFFAAWALAQIIGATLVSLGGSTFNTCF